jgi:hypothetical protein
VTDSAERELATSRPARRIVEGGFGIVIVSIVLFLSLDVHAIVTTGSRLEPAISAHGLGGGRRIFTAAVVLLAAGSAGFLIALVGRQLTVWKSGAAAALALWIIGLICIAAFPKQVWSQPVSISGIIHWAASALAFLSLPIAAILLARPWLRDRNHARCARWTLIAGVISILAFAPLVYAMGVDAATGVDWWDVVTFGHTERLIAAADAATLVVIGKWAHART